MARKPTPDAEPRVLDHVVEQTNVVDPADPPALDHEPNDSAHDGGNNAPHGRAALGL